MLNKLNWNKIELKYVCIMHLYIWIYVCIYALKSFFRKCIYMFFFAILWKTNMFYWQILKRVFQFSFCSALFYSVSQVLSRVMLLYLTRMPIATTYDLSRCPILTGLFSQAQCHRFVFHNMNDRSYQFYSKYVNLPNGGFTRLFKYFDNY